VAVVPYIYRIHTKNTEHITKHTVHRTTQTHIKQHTKYIKQHKKYIEQHKNLEECGPYPVFAGFTLAFALQLRKMHGKTSVKVVVHKRTMKIYRKKNKKHKLHYQTGIKPFIQ
jgi:hypothetical protein